MLSKIESKNFIQDESKIFRKNILCLHKLTDRFTYGSTNYSPRRFSRLIDFLSDAGYKFVSLKEVISSNDPKQLAITFDDGYAHLMQTLPPLIEKQNLKPTIFIPTAIIGKQNRWDYSSIITRESHLDKLQIAELASIGVEFGAHGHRHIDLTRIYTESLQDELRQSKGILEDITNHAVNSLSYPFGRFNSVVVKAAQNTGYNRAFTMRFPGESDSALAIGRLPVYFFDNFTFIRQKLNGRTTRSVHQKLNRLVNVLSHGTTVLNQLTGRN